MLMVMRPSLSDIHGVLAAHSAVIVHFSGTPKGGGSTFEYPFPRDLEEVIAGRSLTGLSCSTVMPGDEFCDLNRANATGCIGVLLGLQTPQSVLDAHPHDCGTYMADGVRQVPHARDMTASDFDATITGRANGEYNEWVIANYQVIGLFVAEPYRVSIEVEIDYPEDMPDYLRGAGTAAGFDYKSLAEIATLFPNLPIYAFASGGVVEHIGSAWVPVTHKTLYP
ncbi:hypothetical protein Q9Q95_14185 [Sphingomonas sp. DG1-23]|uniref:hypothetical protein n=1 Tax=Sphingomonas sp. DG1-23 TaxID=3068316 RepID=UPI00273F33EB|nr:hypothetical protein [Sphingomonas sp. DG1-23]MDP5280076.1 hypothetical protein [Sphingomonas sp. DG1-23]